MLPYTRAWLWTAFIPKRLVSSAGSFHCLPSSSAPPGSSVPSLIMLLFTCTLWKGSMTTTSFTILTHYEIQSLWGKWGQEAPLRLASHHAPPSPGHCSYQSAPWPWLSFSCLNAAHDGSCSSCCLVAAFWMAAGTLEVERSGPPPQVGLGDPLLLKSLQQGYQNCEGIGTSSLELLPGVICR